MTKSLHEIVGLPSGSSALEIAHAASQHTQVLFRQAAGGNFRAQRELVELQYAYLVWAYGRPPAQDAAMAG